MEQYSDCRDDDLVLKLKRHTVVVRSASPLALLLISTTVINIPYIGLLLLLLLLRMLLLFVCLFVFIIIIFISTKSISATNLFKIS